MTYKICSFYKFIDLSAQSLNELKLLLEKEFTKYDLTGLIILASEGINGTLCLAQSDEENTLNFLKTSFEVDEVKFAKCQSQAFPRFKVRLREEIVTTGLLDTPDRLKREGKHLNAKQWHQVLESKEDVTLIDTRNWYETDLGTFNQAVDPRLVNFQEFPDFVEKEGFDKKKKVLMYCTGGIRCEKAALIMEDLGYQDVYQLQGGILKYLEQYPEGHFDGECFVFDHRVAVDKNLEPSKKYSLCPHTGQPAEHWIECINCAAPARVTIGCLEEEALKTCSKNCANIYRRKQERKVA